MRKFPDVEAVDEISTTQLERWLYDGRLDLKWTADTFLNYYKGVKVFLDWCVKKGYLSVNPILGIEKPKLSKKLPKRITSQDAMRVMEYSFSMRTEYRFERYRNRAIFAVMIYAGLRAQEVLGLKIEHVDMENRIIRVFGGKGGKDRVVPMASVLYRYLKEYMTDRDRLRKELEYVFLSLRGNARFTYRGLVKVIIRIKKATKIEFSSHRLRHTFATLMLEGGCDLFSLQKMMGHADIKTTTIYLSATVELLQEQMLKHPLG